MQHRMRHSLAFAFTLCACASSNNSAPFTSHDAGASRAGSSALGHPDAAVSVDAGAADAATKDSGGICTYDPNAGPTPGCVTGAPSDCTGTAPSYQHDVAPAITSYCVPCHRVGGLAPDKPFSTYAEVYKTRSTMLNRLSRCLMPPACAEQPSADARAAMLAWFVCDAPNN
jgi:hypothetical protein